MSAWWEQTPAAKAARARNNAASLEVEIERLEHALHAKRAALIALLSNRQPNTENGDCCCCCCQRARGQLGRSHFGNHAEVVSTTTGDQ